VSKVERRGSSIEISRSWTYGEGMAIVRILLVEDDEVMSSSLTSLLAQFGCAITTATDVPQALRYISSETYDVLLSDLHMLGSGDGSSVINAMRQANPEAVTLLLSGSETYCWGLGSNGNRYGNLPITVPLLPAPPVLLKNPEISGFPGSSALRRFPSYRFG
jgi:CheY-like chemotaxis protein